MPIETPPMPDTICRASMATARPARANAEDFFLHVGGNRFVAAVLHVAAVNAESRQSLLRVAGQHGGEINRAGPLGAVETPHGLGNDRVHVHRLAAVTPARRHGQRQADAFAREFFRAGGGLGHAADAGVGDDALRRVCRSGNAVFRRSSRATALARFMVCVSSDSRTPPRRPSMVGRMPILGSFLNSGLSIIFTFVKQAAVYRNPPTGRRRSYSSV